jgi:hypothetical protein
MHHVIMVIGWQTCAFVLVESQAAPASWPQSPDGQPTAQRELMPPFCHYSCSWQMIWVK